MMRCAAIVRVSARSASRAARSNGTPTPTPTVPGGPRWGRVRAPARFVLASVNRNDVDCVVHTNDGCEEITMTVRRIALLLAALLLLAACGGADDEAAGEGGGTSEAAAEVSEPAPEPSEPASSEPAAGTSEDAAAADGGAIEVSSTDLGDILVDGEGMTLYVFDNDTDGTSACTGDCAANWPPLSGEVTVGEGVDESLLGTTERDDGSVQVTYADQPLYYFAGDQAAGDVNGQAVGGIWWVVGADGEKITEEVSGTTTSDGIGY